MPDIFVGSEGARLIPGLGGFEEGLQTQKSGDFTGAEERGVHQTGDPAQEGERERPICEQPRTECRRALTPYN